MKANESTTWYFLFRNLEKGQWKAWTVPTSTMENEKMMRKVEMEEK